MPLDSIKADLGLCIRLLKYSKCIPSIYPYLSYERKHVKSSKDTATSTDCLLWTCCCFKATRNFRYIALLVDIRRTHAGRLSSGNVFTRQTLTQHTTGNTELLEADTTCDEVFSGNRESDGQITCRFHARLFGGRHLWLRQ